MFIGILEIVEQLHGTGLCILSIISKLYLFNQEFSPIDLILFSPLGSYQPNHPLLFPSEQFQHGSTSPQLPQGLHAGLRAGAPVHQRAGRGADTQGGGGLQRWGALRQR